MRAHDYVPNPAVDIIVVRRLALSVQIPDHCGRDHPSFSARARGYFRHFTDDLRDDDRSRPLVLLKRGRKQAAFNSVRKHDLFTQADNLHLNILSSLK